MVRSDIQRSTVRSLTCSCSASCSLVITCSESTSASLSSEFQSLNSLTNPVRRRSAKPAKATEDNGRTSRIKLHGEAAEPLSLHHSDKQNSLTDGIPTRLRG